jgi:hypothetical protein
LFGLVTPVPGLRDVDKKGLIARTSRFYPYLCSRRYGRSRRKPALQGGEDVKAPSLESVFEIRPGERDASSSGKRTCLHRVFCDIVAHGTGDAENDASSLPAWSDCSIPTQRRVTAGVGILVAVLVLVAFRVTLGLSIPTVLAAVGLGVLVFAVGIESTCRMYGHAVDCATGPFCECERCGRPMDDR